MRKRSTTKRECVEARKLLSSDWALEQEMGSEPVAQPATAYRERFEPPPGLGGQFPR
jgi:hypothetical protein